MNHQQRRSPDRGLPWRRALQWVGIVSLVALFGFVLVACGGGSDSSSDTSGSASSGSGETINLLTWQTYHEQEWLDEFQEETGITVKATNVGSPAEMFSKVKANPGQFDLILNTAGWFPQYIESDLLEPIDESKVTNKGNIKLGFDWEGSTTVNGTNYGILYNWGDQPLGWIPDRLKGIDLAKYENSEGELDDWNVYWDKAAGRQGHDLRRPDLGRADDRPRPGLRRIPTSWTKRNSKNSKRSSSNSARR